MGLRRIFKSMPDASSVHVPGVMGKKKAKKAPRPQYPNAVNIL